MIWLKSLKMVLKNKSCPGKLSLQAVMMEQLNKTWFVVSVP